MINIVSNIGYALLALLILTIILHFFLVYPKNLSKRQWKKVDYIWISLTAVGLIGATDSARLLFDNSQVSIDEHRIPAEYQYTLSFLLPEGSKIVCREHKRDEYSPPNYDSIVADDDRSCAWSKQVYNIVSSIDTSAYPPIDTTKIPQLTTVVNVWFKGLVLDNIRRYNTLVLEKQQLESDMHSEGQLLVKLFTPLLLILGLAIRITKVSGELRHEKG